MSSLFQTYVELGFKHIADIAAYDHILFIVALCAIYRISEWKKVAILATAFTIGHSITLALAALDIISFHQKTVELLIPVTIFITCLYNIFGAKTSKSSLGFNKKQPFDDILDSEDSGASSLFNKSININYLFALFFGLIHGMGFSNFLKAMLMPGEENLLVKQLFAFNVGIELGQLLIVSILLGIAFVVLTLLKVKQSYWNISISAVVGLMAVNLFVGQL